MNFITEDIIKLLISAGTGAIIGLEREYHSKSAGLRTMILICLGSTLFTIISIKLGSDPARIAANIVTGIGFVGGGIIFRDNSNGRITGITTAAAAWVTAGYGRTRYVCRLWKWSLRNWFRGYGFGGCGSLFPRSNSAVHQTKKYDSYLPNCL